MNRKFAFNKLGRIKVIDTLRTQGITVHTQRFIQPEQETKELLKKLAEEFEEVRAAQNKSELLEELADLLEVMYAIAHKHNTTPAMLEEIRQKKRAERGGYDECIYISYVELDEHHPRVQYYLDHPDKHPEIK